MNLVSNLLSVIINKCMTLGVDTVTSQEFYFLHHVKSLSRESMGASLPAKRASVKMSP
jgi:hypothetical protein